MKSRDVIIIGGGLIGACCADELTARGLRVTLLERHFPASGSSRACDGLILLWDKSPGTELSLGLASVALWEELVPRLGDDIEYRQTGTLLVAERESSLQSSHELVEGLQAYGIRASLLDPVSMLELEPALAPDLAGGAYFPADYQVDPRRATLAIVQKARRQGLNLKVGEPVIDLKAPASRGAGWKVVTSMNSYAAQHVVCAAGVWSTPLLDLAGVSIPVHPRKGHILVVRTPGDMLHHPLLEGGYEATVHDGSDELQVALVAELTPAGTMLVGSSRQFVGFDTRVSWQVLQALAQRANRFIPGLSQCNLIRSYAGLRPWSPDHLPLIGPVGGHEDLLVATGHEGAGICLAPITGRLIADWVTGSAPSDLAQAVMPGRLNA